MEKVVWWKGDFELIENTFDEKPIYYFQEVYSNAITKSFKSFDEAIEAKDKGKLKFY